MTYIFAVLLLKMLIRQLDIVVLLHYLNKNKQHILSPGEKR